VENQKDGKKETKEKEKPILDPKSFEVIFSLRDFLNNNSL
jgi:hypothetical protein